MLVPEIALTLWVGRLVRARFGETVAVLHSGLPDIERAREWWRVRNGQARIVVGTRSAVFAPVENLGLIIVDEEQESSYKQEETPRYNGRDTAVYRARLEGAVVLLGSATPSLETYHNARAGKYHLLELVSRVANRPLADVRIVDLREEFRSQHRATPVSEKLREAIALRLEEGTQAMVLINRRGYSWSLLCRGCGAFVQCQNCSIALTYHKIAPAACSATTAIIRCARRSSARNATASTCISSATAPSASRNILREQFPKARLARLDRDTVRTKREYQQVLGAFAQGEIDVLVGTQMVAKGHDFQRVTLVGVVAADLALGRPDFRAAERTFQLLTQVAGRAGRGELAGEVLVETYYPEHYAIQFAARQDFISFYEKEAHFRRMLHYPPFTALANVIVRDKKVENAIRWSRALESYFAPFEAKGVKILGPAAAPLARLRREYRFQFVLKSPQRAALAKILNGCLDFCASKEIPETAVIVDRGPGLASIRCPMVRVARGVRLGIWRRVAWSTGDVDASGRLRQRMRYGVKRSRDAHCPLPYDGRRRKAQQKNRQRNKRKHLAPESSPPTDPDRRMPVSQRENQQRAAPQIPAGPRIISQRKQTQRDRNRNPRVMPLGDAVNNVPAIELPERKQIQRRGE